MSDEEVKNSLLDLWQQSTENKQLKTVIQDLLLGDTEEEEQLNNDTQDQLETVRAQQAQDYILRKMAAQYQLNDQGELVHTPEDPDTDEDLSDEEVKNSLLDL